MAVERRRLWLGALLIAAIVAAIVVRSTGGSVAPVPRGRAAARPPATDRSAKVAGPETPTVVNLQALSQTRGEPEDEGRNPFRFRPKAAPPPAVPVAPVARPGNQTPAPVVPAGPPPPPPIPLKFIGIVQKLDGTKIAVLSDGRRPYHGVEGQEIDGQYKILKVGLESIEIAYLDGRGRQTLRLDGSAKN